MNPGKVIGKSMVSRAIGAARLLEPVTRMFGNNTKTRIGEFAEKDLKGIPADVAWHAYQLFPMRILRQHLRSILRPWLGKPIT